MKLTTFLLRMATIAAAGYSILVALDTYQASPFVAAAALVAGFIALLGAAVDVITHRPGE